MTRRFFVFSLLALAIRVEAPKKWRREHTGIRASRSSV